MSLIFSLRDLYVKRDYSISRQIEQIILDKFISLYNLKQQDVEISQGCDSSYDFRIKDKTFELKIMSTSFYNIEVSRANGDKSGLTASEADYYLIANPGYLYGQEVMKLRVVSTKDLREAVSKSVKVKVYPANEHNSLGSICHQIDPKMPHDFLGYFKIVDKIGKDYFIDFLDLTFFNLGRFCEIKIHEGLLTNDVTKQVDNDTNKDFFSFA